MGDVTFFASLTANINRLLPKEKTAFKETVVVNSGSTAIEPLLKRAFMFLEDSDFARADDFCEQVLNIDPECAEAYLGKLMVELGINKREALKNAENPFDNKNIYQKIIRYGDTELKAELEGYIEYIKDRNERARIEGIYNQGKDAMSSYSFERAINLFESINDYKDSLQLAEKCKELDEEDRLKRERRAKEAREYTAAQAKRKKTIITILSSVVAVIIVFAIVLNTVIIPYNRYNNAVDLMNAGEYREALGLFWLLDDYKDSEKYALDLLRIITPKDVVSAGRYPYRGGHTVGLKSDGSVVAVGDRRCGLDVEDWTDIVAVSAGMWHTVGLKSDGTVVATGFSHSAYDVGQCNVGSMSGIVSISAGDKHTVALKNDGTVVAVGDNTFGQCDVYDWSGIIAISAGSAHTVGLRYDGTVVAVGYESGVDYVSGWTDVVAISAGDEHIVGLKSDGTVLAVGEKIGGRCDVSEWTDIIAISAGGTHTVGLKSDGTVVATGSNSYDSCDVASWTDIVAISAGGSHTIGLKTDGTVVAVGDNSNGQCDVSSWSNIKIP
jgi:hypothetical protein